MAKGAAIKFISYNESVTKLLDLMNLKAELKKYDKIVLKPNLTNDKENSTSVNFVESVLKFCLQNKNPVAEVFIAEGADGFSTEELFHSQGFGKLAEKYQISLIDLNNAETEEIENYKFIKFSSIEYPKILKNSFLISLAKLFESEETEISDSLSNMLGAFPSKNYSGFFSSTKNKIRKWPIKYAIHDILLCKMPNFSILDASEQGTIFAGLPIEIDKQAAKFIGKDWQRVPHLNLLNENLSSKEQ